MRHLNIEEIDITGFAAVRELVFVMSPSAFGPATPAHTLPGLGSLQYLADAHMRPGGQTGMHHHKQVTIVTLMLNGTLLHRGDLGNNTTLSRDQAQVQCSGSDGFQHNEINGGDGMNRFLQLWFDARHQTGPAHFTHTALTANEDTLLFQDHDGPTRCWLKQMDEGDSETMPGQALAFVVEGTISVRDKTDSTATLSAACACQGEQLTLTCTQASRILLVSDNPAVE